MCDGAVQDKTSHCEAFKFCHLEKPLLTVCARLCGKSVTPPGFLIKYVNCPQTPNLQIRNYVNCKLTDKY